MPFNKAKNKIKEYLNKYVKDVMFPSCYIVYRRLMNDCKVVDQETFMQMVHDEMKTPEGERL